MNPVCQTCQRFRTFVRQAESVGFLPISYRKHKRVKWFEKVRGSSLRMNHLDKCTVLKNCTTNQIYWSVRVVCTLVFTIKTSIVMHT